MAATPTIRITVRPRQGTGKAKYQWEIIQRGPLSARCNSNTTARKAQEADNKARKAAVRAHRAGYNVVLIRYTATGESTTQAYPLASTNVVTRNRKSYLVADQGTPGKQSRGARGGPYAKDKPWITRACKLNVCTPTGKVRKGGHFLKDMSFRQQQDRLDAVVREYGYRSALGSLMALERAAPTRGVYGMVLKKLREWLVAEHGGPGSFGPRKK